MKTSFSIEAVSPVRFTAAALAAAAVWLFVPELALAAVTFGDIGQNVADSAKGVAKGVTMAGFASGAGMGVWGCIDLYKASKGQSGRQATTRPESLRWSLVLWPWESGNSSALVRPRSSVPTRLRVLMNSACARSCPKLVLLPSSFVKLRFLLWSSTRRVHSLRKKLVFLAGKQNSSIWNIS